VEELWLRNVVPLQVVIDPDNGTRDGSYADFALSFMGDDMDLVEATFDSFDLGGGAHHGIDAYRNSMLDTDTGAD
jgi:hypothetical protein